MIGRCSGHRAAMRDLASFRPDRFADRMPGPYGLRPRGSGHPETGHRCPGERITMRLLDATLQVLASTAVTEPVGTGDHARTPVADR